MLNQFFQIPSKFKNVLYNPSPNTYIIDVEVKDPPQVIWSQETLEELSDKDHLRTIKKARLEYKRGQLVDEIEIFEKLKV
jgi:hypothetical protein